MESHEHNPGEPEFGEHAEDAPHNLGEQTFGDEPEPEPDEEFSPEAAAGADEDDDV